MLARNTINECKYGAYLHVTNENRIFYVGKGTRKRSRQIYGRNKYYDHVVSKNGKENIDILFMPCSSEKIAFDLEIRLIKCLKRNGISLTNMTDGGEGASGNIKSAETIEKLRLANTGKVRPIEVRRAISKGRKGIVFSQETKDKMSKSKTGVKIHTDDSKQAISERMIGNKYAVGNKLTEEHKLKISSINKGKPLLEETKEKIRQSKLGIPRSEETIIKMRNASLGRKHNDITKEKLSKLTAHTKWMNNSFISKRIKEDVLDKYINDGWVFGKLNKKLIGNINV